MSHIHWVTRQNKLEIPRDKDEVNKWEIHECDGWGHDPDTMVDPLTPKPTHKAQSLVREPSTVVSRREEDVALRKWQLSRYCCVSRKHRSNSRWKCGYVCLLLIDNVRAKDKTYIRDVISFRKFVNRNEFISFVNEMNWNEMVLTFQEWMWNEN